MSKLLIVRWCRLSLLLLVLAADDLRSQGLELVLEIGSGDIREEYTFFRITDLAVDEQGHIWVLDAGAKSAAVYDGAGAFVQRLGREGSGPGEFLRPVRIGLTEEHIIVHDAQQGRISWFARTGGPVQTRAMPRPAGLDLSHLYEMRDGSTVAASLFRAVLGGPGHDPYLRIVRLRSKAQVDTLLSIEVGAVLWSAPEGLPWGIAPRSVGQTGAFAVGGDSLLVLVDAVESSVRVIKFSRSDSELVRRGRLPIEARPVDAQVLQEIELETRARSPTVPSRIRLTAPSATSDLTGSAFLDDEGGVWIETYVAGGLRRWAVIEEGSPRGRWLAVPDRLRILAVRNGLAYGVWRDELDVQTVRVYRLP